MILDWDFTNCLLFRKKNKAERKNLLFGAKLCTYSVPFLTAFPSKALRLFTAMHPRCPITSNNPARTLDTNISSRGNVHRQQSILRRLFESAFVANQCRGDTLHHSLVIARHGSFHYEWMTSSTVCLKKHGGSLESSVPTKNTTSRPRNFFFLVWVEEESKSKNRVAVSLNDVAPAAPLSTSKSHVHRELQKRHSRASHYHSPANERCLAVCPQTCTSTILVFFSFFFFVEIYCISSYFNSFSGYLYFMSGNQSLRIKF